MTITLNGRDWSVDDFRDYRRNQPKAPDPAGVPAFPDGIMGDMMAEVARAVAARDAAEADAAAAAAGATSATAAATSAGLDADAADAARLAADAAAAAAQAAVGGVRVSAGDATAGPLTAKLEIVGGAVEVVNPGANEVLRVTIDAADTTALETNLALLAMRQVVAEGWSVTGMVDGVVDEFTDASGLDLAGLNGAGVASGYVTAQSNGADQTTGKTAYASNAFSIYGPQNAIDNGTTGGSFWDPTGQANSTNHWLAVDLGAPTLIGGLRLKMGDSRNIKSFKLQYSADSTNGANGTWIDQLSASHPLNDAWAAYDFTPTTARWWRVYVLDVHPGKYLGIYEMELLPAVFGGAVAFTVVSAAYQPSDPLALPAAARLVLRHQPIGAVVLGTDLIIEASRDGGATWTAGMPVREATIAGIDILAATISLSAQPAGQSMRWRVRTTAVEQRLHAISMHW